MTAPAAGLGRLRTARALVELHPHQLKGSAWLIGAVGANALSGFLFWLVAARRYDEADFGEAAALFSVVLFVNYLTNMGLPVAVARYAPDDGEVARRLYLWSVVVSVAASIIGAIVVVLALPDDVTEPLWRWGQPAGAALFTGIVVGMGLALVAEVRLMTIRLWGWVVGRVALVGVVRLPLLWWDPPGDDALWLFFLVAGVPAISGLVATTALVIGDHPTRLFPLPERTRAAVRFAGVNYGGLLALQAPQFALPVIVAVNVSASTMGSFYVVFSITTILFLVPHVLGQVLLVEASKEGADVRSQARLGLVLAVGLMVVATIGALVLPGVVTLLYGDDFAKGTEILPWFVGAAVPWAVTSILINQARVHNRSRSIIVVSIALALGVLGPAVALTPSEGVDGAAFAWLVGNGLAALIAGGDAVRARVADPTPSPA